MQKSGIRTMLTVFCDSKMAVHKDSTLASRLICEQLQVRDHFEKFVLSQRNDTTGKSQNYFPLVGGTHTNVFLKRRPVL